MPPKDTTSTAKKSTPSNKRTRKSSGNIQSFISMKPDDYERSWRLAEMACRPRQEIIRQALLVMELLADHLQRGNEVIIRGPGGWEDHFDREKLFYDL